MLRQRILSALVLAPPALAAVWFGAWPYVALIALATGLLGWEWSRLCLGRFERGGMILAGLAVLAALLAAWEPLAGLAVVLLAAGVAPRLQTVADRSVGWLAFGAVYVGFPAVSLVWIREGQRETLLWLLLLIWATDIGAYAAGRTIGGPKLLPSVSPKKTWAGLLGGMASAAVVGAATAGLMGEQGPSSLVLAGASALLAVVAQAGDLGESWVKRRFGVKDSSSIIPGHGGVLDRLDGLLATAPVVAILCLAFGGGLTQWR